MIKLNNTHGIWKLVPFPSLAFVPGKSQGFLSAERDMFPTLSNQDFPLWVLVGGLGLI